MIGYDELYTRNIGLFTPEEQQKLRESVVSIAGVDGGGGYQMTLEGSALDTGQK